MRHRHASKRFYHAFFLFTHGRLSDGNDRNVFFHALIFVLDVTYALAMRLTHG